MATEETHTREELKETNRLTLRRICKRMGMTAEDCAKMHADDLIEWILDNQDGGGGAKKAPAKKAPAKKATGAKGKDKIAARRGKAAPKKAAKPEPEPDEPEDTAEVNGDFSEVVEAVTEVASKIDELGEVVNTNFSSTIDDVTDLRAEVYKTQGLVCHLIAWLENEEILTADNAPDGLGGQEKLESLEEETQGNDNGGDE